MRELKIGILILCFIIGISLVIYDAKPSVRITKDIKEEVIDQISLKNYQKIRSSVVGIRHTLHNELKDDGKLLYSSIQSAKWRTKLNMFLIIDDELSRCLAILDESSSLYTDLYTVQVLLEAAVSYRDLQALVDAYNILSDLENFFFYHYRNEVYYDVTKTLAGEVKYKTTVLIAN